MELETIDCVLLAIGMLLNQDFISTKLASSSDPIIDTCGLRNKFPNGWVPKTVDDYTSAYINKISNPVVIAKDIIDKIKLVNSEMNIFCDWNEDQILQAAKKGF